MYGKNTRGKKCLILSIACGTPLLLLLLYVPVSSRAGSAQWAAEKVIRPLRRAFGTVSGLFPFSVMELLYTLLGIGIVVYIILSIVRIVRSNHGERLLLLVKRTGALLLAAVYIACGGLWLWGLEYQTSTFADRENFSAPGVTTDQLYGAAEAFLETTLSLSDSVKRDENGLFDADMNDYFPRWDEIYAGLEETFPSLEVPAAKPKKMTLYSRVMSYMGFSGVYFCFTGESCINIDQPPAFIPFTIAHELAHQKGVASEQECNFLGVAAGLTSGIPEYQYSSGLVGTIHLMNALYRAAPDRWNELRARISGPMLADLEDNNRYWNAMHSPVTETTQKAYDVYLKANGQELGMASYGACVDLLVKFYEEYLR